MVVWRWTVCHQCRSWKFTRMAWPRRLRGHFYCLQHRQSRWCFYKPFRPYISRQQTAAGTTFASKQRLSVPVPWRGQRLLYDTICDEFGSTSELAGLPIRLRIYRRGVPDQRPIGNEWDSVLSCDRPMIRKIRFGHKLAPNWPTSNLERGIDKERKNSKILPPWLPPEGGRNKRDESVVFVQLG